MPVGACDRNVFSRPISIPSLLLLFSLWHVPSHHVCICMRCPLEQSAVRSFLLAMATRSSAYWDTTCRVPPVLLRREELLAIGVIRYITTAREDIREYQHCACARSSHQRRAQSTHTHAHQQRERTSSAIHKAYTFASRVASRCRSLACLRRIIVSDSSRSCSEALTVAWAAGAAACSAVGRVHCVCRVAMW